MRTTRKQFPVKLVDFRKTRFHYSARQSEAESTNEKNGGLCGETTWTDFELINCPTSTKNLPKYRKANTMCKKNKDAFFQFFKHFWFPLPVRFLLLKSLKIFTVGKILGFGFWLNSDLPIFGWSGFPHFRFSVCPSFFISGLRINLHSTWKVFAWDRSVTLVLKISQKIAALIQTIITFKILKSYRGFAYSQ